MWASGLPLSGETALAVILSTVPAYAEPTVFLGFSQNLGQGKSAVAATDVMTSKIRRNEITAASGVTYSFGESNFGLAAGTSDAANVGAVTMTYDFMNGSPHLSANRAGIVQPQPKAAQLQQSSVSLKTGLPTDFDAGRYLMLNPDVKQAGLGAEYHYLNHGQSEGRIYKQA